jgi:hypothetical protein
MTQAMGDYVQSAHAVQQVADETASTEDDLELVGTLLQLVYVMKHTSALDKLECCRENTGSWCGDVDVI